MIQLSQLPVLTLLALVTLVITTESNLEKGVFREFVTLNTGARMPLLTFATYQLKGEVLEEALDKALEAGYRHLDTGSYYMNEESIGKVLNKWFSSGRLKREDIFITGKFPRYATHQPELVPKFLEDSLQKLQLDYLDLYLIHVPFYMPLENGFDENGLAKIVPTNIVAIWNQMEAQLARGKTRAIGVANFNQSQILRIRKNCKTIPAVLQTELHAYLQEKPLVDFCRNMGIAVSAFTPLGTDEINEEVNENAHPSPLQDEAVIRIAQNRGKTPAQILLRFLFQQYIAAIPISTEEHQFKQYIEALSFSLQGNEFGVIKQIDRWEQGRIGRFSEIFKGIERHPEYPQPY